VDAVLTELLLPTLWSSGRALKCMYVLHEELKTLKNRNEITHFVQSKLEAE
jgi:hypothetical protein